MGKILEALFDGNLFVEPIYEKRSREHQRACDIACNLLEELTEQLSAEEKVKLEHAVDALNNESQYYTADRFVRGYCLGALMMWEVMEKREDFISKQRTR